MGPRLSVEVRSAMALTRIIGTSKAGVVRLGNHIYFFFGTWAEAFPGLVITSCNNLRCSSLAPSLSVEIKCEHLSTRLDGREKLK